jgi:hypothetical protein
VTSSFICGLGVPGAEYGSVSAMEEPIVEVGDGYGTVEAGDAAFCKSPSKFRLGVRDPLDHTGDCKIIAFNISW